MSRARTLAAVTAVLLLAACGGGAVAPNEATPGAPSATAPSTPAASAPTASPSGSEPSASEPATGSACQPTSEPVTMEVAMADFAFQPAAISASVGDVIAWTNRDTPPHTATLRDDPACTTPTLASGESGALVFSAAGTYPFFCRIHPSMTGTIEITG